MRSGLLAATWYSPPIVLIATLAQREEFLLSVLQRHQFQGQRVLRMFHHYVLDQDGPLRYMWILKAFDLVNKKEHRHKHGLHQQLQLEVGRLTFGWAQCRRRNCHTCMATVKKYWLCRILDESPSNLPFLPGWRHSLLSPGFPLSILQATSRQHCLFQVTALTPLCTRR